MTSTKRYQAALVILESLIEYGVVFSNSQDDRRYRIIIDSVTGTRYQRNAIHRNFGFVFEPINDILSGNVCNICCDKIEMDDRHGEPVCFHYLTEDEWHWLDNVTRQSSVRFEMSGTERALLYALAIQTGLRSNECRQLTRGKLHLMSNPPFVMSDAKTTKNKKPARQYIQPELANELQQLIATKLGGANVFRMPHPSTVVDMIREDIDRARSAWLETFQDAQKRIEAEAGDFLRSIDSEGERIDFHALRHTTASWLIHSGADIKSVQSVMRHSDIKLTLDRYGHLFPGAEADAVSRLRGAFTRPESLQATGTETGLQIGVQSGFDSLRQGANLRHSSGIEIDNKRHKKTLVSQGLTFKNQGLGAVRALGLEPRTQGLKVPCSTN